MTQVYIFYRNIVNSSAGRFGFSQAENSKCVQGEGMCWLYNEGNQYHLELKADLL